MSDLTLAVRLTADGTQLVGQMSASELASKELGATLADVGTKAKTASTGADALAASTGKVGTASKGATDAVKRNTAAVASNTVSLGAQRAGYQQLGAQVQDSFVQFNAGTSILQILSQQGPQVASALSLAGTAADGTGSKVARLATFFAGPLGAAVFGAATLLGFLIQNLIKSGDESGKAADKSLSLEAALGKEKRGTEAAMAALKAFNKEKEEGRRQDSLSTQTSLDLARARLQEAINTRIALQAIIDKAAAEVASGPTGPNGQGQLAESFVLRRLSGFKTQNEDFIKQLRKTLVNLTIEDAGDAAKAAVDPIAKINREFDHQRDTVKRTAGALDQLTAAQDRQLRSNLNGVEKRRAAAIDEERARQAAERKAARPGKDRSDLSADTGARLLSTAQSYNGLNENRSGDRSTLKELFGEANLNIDPAITAWCAAFVNAVLGKEKLPTNGSLAARSFLNYGSAVDRPEKGDIVVLKRGGNAAQGHVGFYAGEGSNGTIRVTGGNQSNQVSTASFKRSDVLAYRRAPTASQAEAAAEKAAREAERLAGVHDRARDAIGGTLAGFSDAPGQVTKTVQALIKLDGVIADLNREKPPGFAELVASAQAAKVHIAGELGPAIADAVRPFEDAAPDILKAAAATKQLDGALKTIADNRPELEKLLGADSVAALEEQARAAGQTVKASLGQPFRDLIRDQQEGLAVQRLQNDGREVEAEQLRVIQDLQRQYNVANEADLAVELAKRGITADQLEQRLALIEQERALSIEGQRRRDIERTHLAEVDRLRGNIERTIEDLPKRGLKVLGDFGRELKGQFQNYLARYLTETLFGGAFKQLERQLTGQDQVAQANKAYVGQVKTLVDSLRGLETALDGAAAAARGEVVGEGVVITGQRLPKEDPFDFRIKSPRELFGDIAKSFLTDTLKLNEALADKIGDKVGAAFQGAATGSSAAGILFGKKANGTGSAIGGGLGQIAGEEFLGFLGKAAGPIGAIAGGILGSIVGNLFTKPKFGSATLTSATGDIEATGRGAAEIEAAKGAAGSVQDGLKRIAEAFDAQLGSFAVTIGTYKDKFRVNTTGSSTVGGSKKPVAGLKDFGDDEAGAIAYAITDAIADGAVKGVSAAVQQALRSSKDLEAAIVEGAQGPRPRATARRHPGRDRPRVPRLRAPGQGAAADRHRLRLRPGRRREAQRGGPRQAGRPGADGAGRVAQRPARRSYRG